MDQNTAIEFVERTMSVLSIIGFLIIAVTFLKFKSFSDKLFNRLVFYASFGNVGSNIATLISRTGIKAGDHSAVCRIQGFLIQWLMPADALWSFCMAINVFLAFQTTKFHVNLRKLDILYFIICYGLPFIPAMIFMILDLTMDAGFYGNATLWCWISVRRDRYRIGAFYGPVWLIISLIFAIYIYTGRALTQAQVKNKKLELELNKNSYSHGSIGSVNGQSSVTYSREIKLETRLSLSYDNMPRNTFDSESSVTLSSASGSMRQKPAPLKIIRPDSPIPSPIPKNSYSVRTPLIPQPPQRAWLSFPRRHTTTTTMITARASGPPLTQRALKVARTNRGAQTYALVAFVIFLGLLTVWVPATVNRVYSLATNGKVNFAMNLMAAIVLPLQGFFNCVIYLFFSRSELRKEGHKLVQKIRNSWT